MNVLIINFGSSSSKFAYYSNDECAYINKIEHTHEEAILSNSEQYHLRHKAVDQFIRQNNIQKGDIEAIVSRGGLMKPIEGGAYRINEKMYNDLLNCHYGEHISNLSGVVGYKLAEELNINAYTVNPVIVDEMIPEAKLTGIKSIRRQSIFHALNHKGVSNFYAKSCHKSYEDINVIVAHLGSGISIAAHNKGKVIDVNNCFHGDGPMSLERSGNIPNKALLKWYDESGFTLDEAVSYLTKHCGVKSYFNTIDFKSISDRYVSDKECQQFIDALAYQISKEIGMMSVVLKGDVDQIILTGGLSNSNILVDLIIEHVKHISNVTVYPNEFEMQSLYDGVTDVLKGHNLFKEYN